LQEAALLPGDPKRPSERDRIIKQLDAELRGKWTKKLLAEGMDAEAVKVVVNHNLPYFLRARGLDEKLEPHEIGRFFYQLAQRRGFQSARKNVKRKADAEEEQNKIAAAASDLRAKMDQVSARTLGEYFARYNPFDSMDEKIRGQYTLREMYKDEFERIWSEQSRHYPEILTDEFKHELLYKLATVEIIGKNGKKQTAYICGLFEQRPLKPQDHLIGDCTLVPGEKRAPWALLEAQRFRYLQKLNDTRIIPPANGEPTFLTPEQHDLLAAELERRDALTFTEAKKLLGLSNLYKFNLGEGGESKFFGNRTAAKFIEVLGDRWSRLSVEQQNSLVADFLKSKDTLTPMQRSIEELALDEKSSKKLQGIKLEQGYCNYSRKALANILPHLLDGLNLHDSIVHAC
jgi:CRISPR-associated endonuclease Csn1